MNSPSFIVIETPCNASKVWLVPIPIVYLAIVMVQVYMHTPDILGLIIMLFGVDIIPQMILAVMTYYIYKKNVYTEIGEVL